MTILRQSTGIDVRVGPFVDATDGVTPETGVTLGAADQAEALKANGAATVDISGRTFAAVTGCDGWYDLTLTTGDTDTVGELVIVVQDSSVCLPVFKTFQVVEAATYDMLYADGATPLADINAECDTAISDASLATAANLATVDTVADGIKAVTDNLPNSGALTDLATAASIAALNDISTSDVNAQVTDVLKTDTVSQLSQGAPPATPTMEDILMYLYTELIRNKVVVDTNTANQKQIFADDGSTILYEKDLTNASDVTTIAEATTGA